MHLWTASTVSHWPSFYVRDYHHWIWELGFKLCHRNSTRVHMNISRRSRVWPAVDLFLFVFFNICPPGLDYYCRVQLFYSEIPKEENTQLWCAPLYQGSFVFFWLHDTIFVQHLCCLPDLAPGKFVFFLKMKITLKVQCCDTVENIQCALQEKTTLGGISPQILIGKTNSAWLN